MPNNFFVGVDPGKTGGVTVISEDDITIIPIPKEEKDIANIFRDIGAKNKVCAIIEKVHAMPGQGVTSCFTFGSIYGLLKGCMHCFNIPFKEVSSKRWMKEIGLFYGPGVKKSQRKVFGLNFAEQRFGSLDNLNIKTADSLLIAEFCKGSYDSV